MSEWGGCVASAKIEGQWMNGPWVITNPQSLLDKVEENKNWHAGDGECPAIAQQLMEMPFSGFWRPGVKVLGNEDYLEKNVYGIGKTGLVRGTAIATFIDKRYPSHLHGNHVAIYLSQTKDSIEVIDQWVIRKQGKITYQVPHKRTLYVSSGISNNADAFSVIYTL